MPTRRLLRKQQLWINADISNSAAQPWAAGQGPPAPAPIQHRTQHLHQLYSTLVQYESYYRVLCPTVPLLH